MVLREVGHVSDYCAATVAAVTDQEQASRSRTAYPSWRTVAPRILHPEIGR
ncbi:MAG TPA: hypothetical protein VFF32_14515 [Dermatophilaceae bacterium]|nr:hypothetical protein [Dermatophilaceae bacterium]